MESWLSTPANCGLRVQSSQEARDRQLPSFGGYSLEFKVKFKGFRVQG